MTNKLKKFLIVFLLLSFLAQSSFVFALEINWPNLPGVEPPGEGQGLGPLLRYFLTLFFFIALTIAVVMVIAGGISYLVSGARPAAKVFAKRQITAAFTGLFILLLSYLVLYTINPELAIFKIEKAEAPPPPTVKVSEPSAPTYIYEEVPTGKLIEDTISSLAAQEDFQRILLQVERVKEGSSKVKQAAQDLQNAVDVCQCGTSKCEAETELELGLLKQALRCECRPRGCTDVKCDNKKLSDYRADIQTKTQALKVAIEDLRAERTSLIGLQPILVRNYLQLKRAGLFMNLPEDVVDYNQFLLLKDLTERAGGKVVSEQLEGFPSPIIEGERFDPATFYFSYDSLENQRILFQEAPRTNPALVLSNTAPKEIADMAADILQEELGKIDNLEASLTNLSPEQLDKVAITTIDEATQEVFQEVSSLAAQEVAKDIVAAVADEMAAAIAEGFSTPDNELACGKLPFLAELFLPQEVQAAIIEGLEQCSDFSKEISQKFNDLLYEQLKEKLPEDIKNILSKSLLDVIDIATVAEEAARVCEPGRASFENVCLPDQADVRALCSAGTILYNQRICASIKEVVCNPGNDPAKTNQTEECQNMQKALKCQGVPPGDPPPLTVFGVAKNPLCLENQCNRGTIQALCDYTPTEPEKEKYNDLKEKVCPAPSQAEKIEKACQEIKEAICSGKCPARPSVILNTTVKRLLVGREGEEFLKQKVLDTLPGGWGDRLQQRLVDVISKEWATRLVWLDNFLRNFEKTVLGLIKEGVSKVMNRVVGQVFYYPLKIVPDWFDRALLVRSLFESWNQVVTGIVSGWFYALKEVCINKGSAEFVFFTAFGQDFELEVNITTDTCRDLVKGVQQFEKILHQGLYTQFYQMFPREIRQILGSSVESAIAYGLRLGCMVSFCGLGLGEIQDDLKNRFGKKWTELDLKTISKYEITGPCRAHFASFPEDQQRYQRCVNYVQRGKAVFDNKLISALPDQAEKALTQTFYRAFTQSLALRDFLQKNLAVLLFGDDVANMLKNKSPWNLLQERKERIVISLAREDPQEPISFDNIDLVVKVVDDPAKAGAVAEPKAVFTIAKFLEKSIGSLLYNTIYQMFIKPYLPYYLRATLYNQLPNAFTMPVWETSIKPITYKTLDGEPRTLQGTPLFTPGSDNYNDIKNAFTSNSFLNFLLQKIFDEPYGLEMERESCAAFTCAATGWQNGKCQIDMPRFLNQCTLQKLPLEAMDFLKTKFLLWCDQKAQETWGNECAKPGSAWLCRCPIRYSLLQLIQAWLQKAGGPETGPKAVKLFNALFFGPIIKWPDAIYEASQGGEMIVVRDNGTRLSYSLYDILTKPFKDILLAIVTPDPALQQEARKILFTKTKDLLPRRLREDLNKNIVDLFGERAFDKKNFSGLALVELIPKDKIKIGDKEYNLTWNTLVKIILRFTKKFSKPKEAKETCRGLNPKTGRCRGTFLTCETEPAPGADKECQVQGATSCTCQAKADQDKECGTNACCAWGVCQASPGRCVQGKCVCDPGTGLCTAVTKERPWYIEDFLRLKKSTCQVLKDIDKMNTLQRLGAAPGTLAEWKEAYPALCQKPMYQALFGGTALARFLETSIWQRIPRQQQLWLQKSLLGLIQDVDPWLYQLLTSSYWDILQEELPETVKRLFTQGIGNVLYQELKENLASQLGFLPRNYTPLRGIFAVVGIAAGNRLEWERLYLTLNQSLTTTFPVLNYSFIKILAGPDKCQPKRHLVSVPDITLQGVGTLAKYDLYLPSEPEKPSCSPTECQDQWDIYQGELEEYQQKKQASCDLWDLVQSSPVNLVEKRLKEIIAEQLPENVKEALLREFILYIFDKNSFQALKDTKLIDFIPCVTDKIANRIIDFVCKRKKGDYCATLSEEENAFKKLVMDALAKIKSAIGIKTVEQIDASQEVLARAMAGKLPENFAQVVGEEPNFLAGTKERMGQRMAAGPAEKVMQGHKDGLEKGWQIDFSNL